MTLVRQLILCGLLMLVPLAIHARPITDYADHRFAPSASTGPAGLNIRWFGAASVVIDDGESAILIDPFVSRAENSAFDILLRRPPEFNETHLQDQCAKPDVMRAKAIFVGHTHYDHVVDVPGFATCTKAPVYGSADAVQILTAFGQTNVTQIAPTRRTADGRFGAPITIPGSKFKVYVLSGKHGRPPTIYDPLSRTVSTPFDRNAPLKDYGLGQIYVFLITHPKGNILHIGSAGVRKGAFDNLSLPVDALLLSLVGRGRTVRYLKATVGKVQPRYVIPIHYDDIFVSLSDPTHVTPVAGLGRFFDKMEEHHKGAETGLIYFNQIWTLPPR